MTVKRITLCILVYFGLFALDSAYAHHYHYRHHRHHYYRQKVVAERAWSLFSFFQQPQQQQTQSHLRPQQQPQRKSRPQRIIARLREFGNAQMLAHPAGCPFRLFCACGAAVDLGLDPRTHMAARSYYRYPVSQPEPNTVAVRPHHVFVLKRHIEGLLWLVADYNSGGHASRLHVRSIAGYSIRRPRG